MRNLATFNNFPHLSPVSPIWHLQSPPDRCLSHIAVSQARMLLCTHALLTLLGLYDSRGVGPRTHPPFCCSPTPRLGLPYVCLLFLYGRGSVSPVGPCPGAGSSFYSSATPFYADFLCILLGLCSSVCSVHLHSTCTP